MKKILVTFAALLAITGLSVGVYMLGHDAGQSVGWNLGHDVGYKDAQNAYVAPRTYLIEYNDLQNKYNTLVNDYNVLAQAPKYQPISCSSMVYGSNNQFVSTNCY